MKASEYECIGPKMKPIISAMKEDGFDFPEKGDANILVLNKMANYIQHLLVEREENWT